MSKIPADVMATARKLYNEHHNSGESDMAKCIAAAIMAERERCAAFAFEKHDWPARWIASSFRGENSAYHDFEVPE